MAAEKGCSLHCCKLTEADVERIRATLDDYVPGTSWGMEHAIGPACRCGRRRQAWKAEGGGFDDGSCPRHPHKDPAPPFSMGE